MEINWLENIDRVGEIAGSLDAVTLDVLNSGAGRPDARRILYPLQAYPVACLVAPEG